MENPMKTAPVFRTTRELGAAVREARKSRKLTQGELAFASGVGLRFISDLENGKATVQLEKIMLVLAALGGGLTLWWNNDKS